MSSFFESYFPSWDFDDTNVAFPLNVLHKTETLQFGENWGRKNVWWSEIIITRSKQINVIQSPERICKIITLISRQILLWYRTVSSFINAFSCIQFEFRHRVTKLYYLPVENKRPNQHILFLRRDHLDND